MWRRKKKKRNQLALEALKVASLRNTETSCRTGINQFKSSLLSLLVTGRCLCQSGGGVHRKFLYACMSISRVRLRFPCVAVSSNKTQWTSTSLDLGFVLDQMRRASTCSHWTPFFLFFFFFFLLFWILLPLKTHPHTWVSWYFSLLKWV